MSISESHYFVELRFPKRDLLEILRSEDKKALWDFFMEILRQYMEECVG